MFSVSESCDQGGVWTPQDGVVTAQDVAMTFAKIAKEKGFAQNSFNFSQQ